MPRFYFHARLGNYKSRDEVGIGLPDLTLAPDVVAVASIASGLTLSEAWLFEVADESGEVVMRVPISEVPRKQ